MHIWLIKLVFQEIQGNGKYRNQSSDYLRGEEGVVIGKKDNKGASGVASKSLFLTHVALMLKYFIRPCI